MRPGRAGGAAGWVPAFLPRASTSSRSPRGRSSAGVCVAGAAAAGAARGAGVQAGRPRPPGLPAAPERPRAPTSVTPRPGPGGTLTYSVGRTPREPAGHAPRATPWRQPVGPLPLLGSGAEWGEEWK